MLTGASGQSTCISFPTGFIPFSSITYVTAADSAGDHLVVGVPSPAMFSFISANLPLPAFANQTFCDAQVQLAPQQYYPNVYVPTAAELTGNFGAFAGLLANSANAQPYPNGQIPAGQLGNVFAWRIGPAQVTSASQGWSPTGSMTFARSGHAALLLPSGKVLVVGGGSTAAELYDPTTGGFAPAGQMRFSHGSSLSATLLNNGLVLIVGGTGSPSAAELYDPSSGQFMAIGQTVQPHGSGQTATLLNDGRVLLVGGYASSVFPSVANSGAETYDPSTGAFASAGAMAVNRNAHTATLLADGRVLIAGGYPPGGNYPVIVILNTAEIFSPSTGGFALVGSMQADRGHGIAALLPSGRVLVGAGYAGEGSADLFDPSTGIFAPAGGMSSLSRAVSTAALLSSGQVLLAGGANNNGTIYTNSAELYNPATGTFVPTGSMGTTRTSSTATLLLNGQVLVTGGTTSPSGPASSSAELYTPTTEGLVTSQTGLTFRVAAGSTAVPPQTVAVLSNTATIPWTVSAHTYQGGGWLSVTPTIGNSAPGAAPTTLTITANPSGLAAQDYYGAVILTPTDSMHPPITIAIVLHIVPPGTAAPPGVAPSGLLFLGTPGATLKTQSFTISNVTSTPLTFNALASTSPSWLTFTPATGSIAAAQSTSITVTATLGTMTAGVYPASIKLLFGDGSTQTVSLLLVISATGGTANVRLESERFAVTPPITTTCTASKLLPVFTTIGTGFNTPAAWPTALVVQVVDDCGNAFNTGSVIVSFSDGDPPIGLLAIGNGKWAGTWVPQNNSAGFTVRADAQQLPLTGSVQVTGQVLSNPSVPVVSKGGIVSNADFASAPALGLLVSIFGSGLADGSAGDAGVPLPTQLGSTSVVLSGTQLPLLYVSNTQLNVAIPFDVPINSSQQLVVLRGNAVSVPVPLAVFASAPSILTVSGYGSGQGLIYDAVTGTQANASSPTTAGSFLVMYTLGLGPVTPALSIENGTPTAPLSYAVGPVTATIGGVPATVLFAGLTPGYVGLYQVNVSVPSGITPGNQVPVTISVAGKSSAGNVSIAVQ